MSSLKERVFQSNLDLVKYGLIVLTWGNVSALSEDGKEVIIKPSGVSYDTMKAEDMVITDRKGNVLSGTLNPSTDLYTHLEIYNAFPNVRGVCHTHSKFATAQAQSGIDLLCYGTTHADYFYGSVPCARELTPEEIQSEYEKNTGLVIVETFKNRGIDPDAVPAVLVKNHGPFTWGPSPEKAVENALVLDECARMTMYTKLINADATTASQAILNKHYFRKHGKEAYYGQKQRPEI